jgi:hypothetical protein
MGLFRTDRPEADTGAMKGVLAATAVLGALAIGGLPGLALSLAADDTGSSSTAPARLDGPPGPPAWAHGAARGRDKDRADRADKDKADKDKSDKGDDDAEVRPGTGRPDGRHRGWAKQGGAVPPGWARNHPGMTPHGWTVREQAAGNGDRDD